MAHQEGAFTGIVRTGRKLLAWASSSEDGKVARSPAHASPSGYRLRLRGGDVRYGEFTIRFAPENGGVDLWRPQEGGRVHVSLMKAASGTGKSTLLMNLYRAIQDRLSSPLGFDFDPDLVLPDDVAIGFVPQKAPAVRHWRVRNLLPTESDFAKVLMEDQFHLTDGRRLGQFSGGEIMRLYVASALERLARSSAHAAFLLLDETLDGVGEEEKVTQYIDKIASTWIGASKSKHLHLMLVSHKQLGQGRLEIPNSLSVLLDVTRRGEGLLEVGMRNP